MDKEIFNSLEIDEQVKEFNKLIVSEGSIRKACDTLHIGKTTIRDRFKKHGYIFKDDKYVKDTNTQLEGQTSLIEPVCENKEYNLAELEQIVNRLVDERLNERLADMQKTESDLIELSSKCDGPVKYRSFGVYQTVLDEFMNYAKGERFTLIELISQSMVEFLDKHKK